MRYALTLAGLATMAAAAPMTTSTEQMADDNKYISYVPYARYDPYSKAVEDLAAKMQADAMAMNMKRNAEMGMALDENYSKYAGYKPYAKYDPCTAAVEEAAKMMDIERRDMLNSMHDAHTEETAKLMMDMDKDKRDESHMADNNKYSTYPSYPNYSPYKGYSEDVEHAAEMQKRHEMTLPIPEPVMSDKHKRDMMHTECEKSEGNMAWCMGEGEEGMIANDDAMM